MGAPRSTSDFGTSRLFLADARLALAALNYGRRRALHHVFGTTEEQANALTAVLALMAAGTAYEGGRRALRVPLALTGSDAAMGGFLIRRGALGIAGPAGEDVPLIGTLMVIAAVGGVALPGIRRMATSMRATEDRIRHARIRRYEAARRLAAERLASSVGKI